MPPRPNSQVPTLAPYALAAPPPAGPGRLIDLAQNESARPPSTAAVAAAAAAAANANLYSAPDAAPLRAAIAAAEGLPAERLLCGNGSMELISLLCQTYLAPGDEVLLGAYAYLFFRSAAAGVGASVRLVPEAPEAPDLDALLAAVGPATKLIFLANPNNPPGTLIPAATIAAFRARLPDRVLLVLDAAYAEFVDDPAYDPGAALALERDDTVMLRTFSKIHGLAGLRVGWGLFPPPVLDAVGRVKLPNSVNAAGQAAAAAALRDREHRERHRRENARTREGLAVRLQSLGLTCLPSHTNFLLVFFPDAPAAARTFAHLRDRRILVRPMGGYGLDSALRITIGNDADMTLVGEEIARALELPACS